MHAIHVSVRVTTVRGALSHGDLLKFFFSLLLLLLLLLDYVTLLERDLWCICFLSRSLDLMHTIVLNVLNHPFPTRSIQFSSRWYLCAREGPYARHPVSQDCIHNSAFKAQLCSAQSHTNYFSPSDAFTTLPSKTSSVLLSHTHSYTWNENASLCLEIICVWHTHTLDQSAENGRSSRIPLFGNYFLRYGQVRVHIFDINVFDKETK